MLVQLPQGMVLTSWIKMADSAGYRKKEKNESRWSCKDRRRRQSEERERLGRRRTSWLEQRKLSEGRNYRRVLQEPRFWGGVAFEWNEYRRTVVRRTFRAGLRNVVHPPLLPPLREEVFAVSIIPLCRVRKPDDDSDRSERSGQILSFVLSEYRRGNGERATMSRYSAKNPLWICSPTGRCGFVTILYTTIYP